VGERANNPDAIDDGDARDLGNSGGRVTVSWGSCETGFGLSGSVFALIRESNESRVGGPGTDEDLTLSRPFFDPNLGVQGADPLVVPGVQGGNLTVRFPREVPGADRALIFNQMGGVLAFDRVSPLVGGRFLLLDEDLLITENVFDLPDEFGTPTTSTTIHDNFETSNRFYGGQLGVESETRIGSMVLKLTGKVAIGWTTQEVRISGDTTIRGADFGVVTDSTRGLLVQPTNVGTFERTEFGVVPEFGARLVWEANEYVHLEVGYSGLYWNRVARPEDQVDTIVNIGAVGSPVQFGTSPNPAVPFRNSSFWAHGLHAGLHFSF
jgi:hypothetical protein